MSRAMNIDLPAADVLALCARHKADVSDLEALPKGATRVVLVNSVGAAAMRQAFGSNVLPDRTARFPLWDARRATIPIG
jgi:hypothetical protein